VAGSQLSSLLSGEIPRVGQREVPDITFISYMYRLYKSIHNYIYTIYILCTYYMYVCIYTYMIYIYIYILYTCIRIIDSVLCEGGKSVPFISCPDEVGTRWLVRKAFVFLVLWSHLETTVPLPGPWGFEGVQFSQR
jgi:hypothetical protein